MPSGHLRRCWIHSDLERPASPPAAGDGVIVTVRGNRAQAFCLAREAREPVWSFPLPAGCALEEGVAPVLAAGLAFLACDDGRVRALSLADGKLAWEQNLAAPCPTTPAWVEAAAGQSRLCCATANAFLHFLDPRTGQRIGGLPLPTPAVTHLCATGSRLYFGTARPFDEIWSVSLANPDDQLVREVFRGGDIAPHLAAQAGPGDARVYLVTRDPGRAHTHFLQMLWFSLPSPLAVASEAAAGTADTARFHLEALDPQGRPLPRADVRIWAAAPAVVTIQGRSAEIDLSRALWTQTDDQGRLTLEARADGRPPALRAWTGSMASGESVSLIPWRG